MKKPRRTKVSLQAVLLLKIQIKFTHIELFLWQMFAFYTETRNTQHVGSY